MSFNLQVDCGGLVRPVVVWLGSDEAVVVVVVGPVVVLDADWTVELVDVVKLDLSLAFSPVFTPECAFPCGCPFLLIFNLKKENLH